MEFTDQSFEIRQMPLSIASVRHRVEQFLAHNDLRMEEGLDYYAGVFAEGEDEMLAGGGLQGDIIKCIAVDQRLRNTNMSLSLISHLLSTERERGNEEVRLFTKPTNKSTFEHLGFTTLAEAHNAILMENGSGLKHYCQQLRTLQRQGTTGIIVMNANPFSLGHQYLVAQAAKQVDTLFVMVVREDCSLFSFTERMEMVRRGCAAYTNVQVIAGSSYAISATTFPSYFLKRVEDATDTQIELDLNLFCRHIAPALSVSKRFVGSEPTDVLTHRYNQFMHNILPQYDMEVVEIERQQDEASAISASRVRKHLRTRHYEAAARLVPYSTKPYLLARLASQSLLDELNTTPKPGLVDKHDSGSHNDKDNEMMKVSIEALHPYFTTIATHCFDLGGIDVGQLKQIGLEAEAHMFDSTHGVNTHKGALFSMGLTLASAATLDSSQQSLTPLALQQTIQHLAAPFQPASNTHGQAVRQSHHIATALENAQGGYAQLFADWLPYYRALQQHDCSDNDASLRLLLHIMTTLEDSNIYYRCGAAMVGQIKQEAQHYLDDFRHEALSKWNEALIHAHVSPGGAADMLALTLFVAAVCSEEETAQQSRDKATEHPTSAVCNEDLLKNNTIDTTASKHSIEKPTAHERTTISCDSPEKNPQYVLNNT